MKTIRFFGVVLLFAILGGLSFNQWQLQRALGRLSAASPSTHAVSDEAMQLRQAEAGWNDAKFKLEIAEQRLAEANARLAQLDGRLRQLENASRARPPGRTSHGPAGERMVEAPVDGAVSKRSWGPEQATGEPDTLEAGDISTAWAPLEQDAGEEWLRLEYDRAVDIAEVRVRETHNPGAISKVTALLANGTEVTLWEGVEPAAAAPVEMAFRVPDTVNAKSVKVYLDTKRVPGWNEIDAVQLVGRDGTRQWAAQASASSTYAEQGVANPSLRLQEF